MKKTTLFKMVLIFSIMLFGLELQAQTTLHPGDIIIVTVSADGADNFDFVPLVDLSAGTVIYFTDNAYTSSGTLRTNEGTITYTASSNVSKGTILSFTGSTSGDWNKGTNYALSASGDNLLAYQGSASSPSFIYGIGWAIGTPWITTGTDSSNNSYIPSSLSTSSKTIVTLGTADNYQYNKTKGVSGIASALLALVADVTNWNSDDANAYPALTGSFTIFNPTITVTETSIEEINGSVGETTTTKIHVAGTELTGDISFSFSGANGGLFTTDPVTLSPASGTVTSTEVSVKYTPIASGTQTTTLTVSSPGATSIVLPITAKAISTGVKNTATEQLKVYVTNDKVMFRATAGESVKIFNSIGQVILNKEATEGLNEISVTNKGLHIIKVGNKTSKIIL